MSYVNPNAQLIADYADLGVSCGYIGNCSLFGGPQYDDRRFMIFTKLRHADRYCGSGRTEPGYSVSVDVSREAGMANTYDTPENRAKLDALRVKLAAGSLFNR